VPFAKTGGLADVAGSLPGALKRLGVEVSVGLPYYPVFKEGRFRPGVVLSGLEVPLVDRILKGDVLEWRTEEDFPVNDYWSVSAVFFRKNEGLAYE